MLSQITLRTAPLEDFWVKAAYRISVTPGHTEDSKHPSEETTPLTTLATRAVFVSPDGAGNAQNVAKTSKASVDEGPGIVHRLFRFDRST